MSIEPYLSKCPLSNHDLEIVASALFGAAEDRAPELTPEQKATADAKLRPYLATRARGWRS